MRNSEIDLRNNIRGDPLAKNVIPKLFNISALYFYTIYVHINIFSGIFSLTINFFIRITRSVSLLFVSLSLQRFLPMEDLLFHLLLIRDMLIFNFKIS